MTDDEAPPLTGVYETILYAQDVAAAAAFYRDVLGLAAIDGPDAFSAAFRLGSGALLLIFDPGRSGTPGRAVPSHGAHGPGHVALAVSDDGALAGWARRLTERGIAVEQQHTRPDGVGRLYFRDPAGNSVELVQGELWA